MQATVEDSRAAARGAHLVATAMTTAAESARWPVVDAPWSEPAAPGAAPGCTTSRFALSPRQWATLRRLLDLALELPPAQRAKWIEHLDATYADFKPRLRALLAHASTTTMPGIDTLPKLDSAARSEQHDAGDSVGPYRLVRLLGAGGMSSVWLAVRDDMLQRRPIALKLPHAAWRAALAQSLVHEREILAALNHPHIARLYDAGSAADGTPYLVLEYVDGVPIDAYCEQRALDCAARLRLFLQVTRAVAHAHGKGIVHCDLKPNNILVTAEGEVRLLDFGVAKLLCAHRAGDSELPLSDPLTPHYASPEQVTGQPCGPAADVYSLGVVLYELLTGRRPYDVTRGSRRELAEAIARAAPLRPSAAVGGKMWRKALRGDLDAIVLKALRKAPSERYPAVAALTADIEAHLAHRPVAARPARVLYRAHKFAVRNGLACLAAAAVLLSALSAAGVGVWQAQIALAERQRTETARAYIDSIFAISETHGAAEVRAFIAASHAHGDPLEPVPDR